MKIKGHPFFPGKKGSKTKEPIQTKRKKFLFLLFLTAHVCGALSSVDAIMSTRTSQGAIAWVISLNTFPAVALPA
jgi:cardiolipin synthase